MGRRLLLASEPEAAPRAVRFAETAAVEAGVPQAMVDRMVLAVAEAVANAVEHGNQDDPQRTVLVEWEDSAGTIWLFIEDEGEGLDATRLQGAALPTDAMDTGGRGLYIIRALADEIRISNEGRRLGLGFVPRPGEPL